MGTRLIRLKSRGFDCASRISSCSFLRDKLFDRGTYATKPQSAVTIKLSSHLEIARAIPDNGPVSFKIKLLLTKANSALYVRFSRKCIF